MNYIFKKKDKPENVIQLIDQMEILKIEKPQNQIDYIHELNILVLETNHFLNKSLKM